LDNYTLLERTMRALAHMQVEGARDFDWSVCFPVPAFDERSIRWDLNYFKYCFLKGTKIEFSEPKLEDEFDTVVKVILAQPAETFLYRDFQSRNVMIKDDKPYFIDFQGGRRGPTQYDVASFLWQAKANFSPEFRMQMVEAYLEELSAVMGDGLRVTEWKAALPHFVLLRTLQVLGAYGYRGYFERKQHFLESIPMALSNLNDLFATHPELKDHYPYICHVSNDLLLLV
jgi:aminoglycoside/choline kinase family phosphotransferase